MKYLLTGLGNIGEQYKDTRHNIGFTLLDSLASQFSISFTQERLGYLALLKWKGRIIYLLKPTTYMNESGQAVRYWLQKLKVPSAKSLVITDNIHLPLGKCRMRPQGGSSGHNGLKSVAEKLASQQFPRLSFGIGNHFLPGHQSDYVLAPFTQEEKEALPPMIEKATQAILAFCSEGITFAMSQYN